MRGQIGCEAAAQITSEAEEAANTYGIYGLYYAKYPTALLSLSTQLFTDLMLTFIVTPHLRRSSRSRGCSTGAESKAPEEENAVSPDGISASE